MERVITIGKVYKHFKGKKYRVLFIATDSETKKDVVVYEALYGKHIIWTMDYDKFNGFIDYPETEQEYRFELVG